MKRNKCPVTGKTRYDTATIANEAMIKIKTHNSLNNKDFKSTRRSTGKSNQKRSYFCKYCKGYHLTSMENLIIQYKKQKERNEEVKKFFTSIDIKAWKEDSIPFESGHFPAPK